VNNKYFVKLKPIRSRRIAMLERDEKRAKEK